MNGLQILVQGQVQGVGFRPKVWQLAKEMGLTGNVRNTSKGVEIKVWGKESEGFVDRLLKELPLLARVDNIIKTTIDPDPIIPQQFEILTSVSGERVTEITPDQNICDQCLAEVLDPFNRRFRYPFNCCVICGPRFSIIQDSPYDRVRTTMDKFHLCDTCLEEFRSINDRRFHAQTIACYTCGPKVWLEKLGGGTIDYQAYSMLDSVDAVAGLLQKGFIVAVKGIGGFHLMSTTEPVVVKKLRLRKNRKSKPLALIARDIDIIKQYCEVSSKEESLLRSSAAPVVVLTSKTNQFTEINGGMNTLGFLLPYTALHHLIIKRLDKPVIMTSGNMSGFPQCTTNEEARKHLHQVADFALMHDRDIHNQIDDSVVMVYQERSMMIRRARGYTPAPLPLPAGFATDTQILAMGAELKNTFCLLKNSKIILSQHFGDLENFATIKNYLHHLDFYQQVYDVKPQMIVVDKHEDYISTKEGLKLAETKGLPWVKVQHHHAHAVSCLLDNNYPLKNNEKMIGIILDGNGLGDDESIWGGEFLLFNYLEYQRIGSLKPVKLLGGKEAIKQPWRNLYAHLRAEMSWKEIEMNFETLPIISKLKNYPIQQKTLEAMLKEEKFSPWSSSCGRLFDAVAALLGLVWEQQEYEGQAAMLLEASVDQSKLNETDDFIYPFRIPLLKNGMPYIEPLSVWQAILGDLLLTTPIGTIAARFHRGLAKSIATLAIRLAKEHNITKVVLSGGCFQNKILLQLIQSQLNQSGLQVLWHLNVPANDGGLALGQIGIALAMLTSTKYN